MRQSTPLSLFCCWPDPRPGISRFDFVLLRVPVSTGLSNVETSDLRPQTSTLSSLLQSHTNRSKQAPLSRDRCLRLAFTSSLTSTTPTGYLHSSLLCHDQESPNHGSIQTYPPQASIAASVGCSLSERTQRSKLDGTTLP